MQQLGIFAESASVWDYCVTSRTQVPSNVAVAVTCIASSIATTDRPLSTQHAPAACLVAAALTAVHHGLKAAVWSVQVLTQEKAAIKIQAGVRGLLTRLQVHRTAQEELQYIGMKPKVCHSTCVLLHSIDHDNAASTVICICLHEQPR